jgi:hypothetical protein
MKVLSGHVSPETAYLVDDYPYGFRLRCKIRYWLEYKPKQGYRLVSQTTNPKQSGEVWNKPKASTYVSIAAAMYLDEKEHVQWTGVGFYQDVGELKAWREAFGEGLSEQGKKDLDAWITRKEIHESRVKP